MQTMQSIQKKNMRCLSPVHQPIDWEDVSPAEIKWMTLVQHSVWPHDIDEKRRPKHPADVVNQGANHCEPVEPELSRLESSLQSLKIKNQHVQQERPLKSEVPLLKIKYVETLLRIAVEVAQSSYAGEGLTRISSRLHQWENLKRPIRTPTEEIVDLDALESSPPLLSFYDATLHPSMSGGVNAVKLAMLGVMSAYGLREFQGLFIDADEAYIYMCEVDNPEELGEYRKVTWYQAPYFFPRHRKIFVAHFAELLRHANDFAHFYKTIHATFDYSIENIQHPSPDKPFDAVLRKPVS